MDKTQITYVAGGSNHLAYEVSGTAFSTPAVGSVPTGLTDYSSGTDIFVPAANMHIGLYELDADDEVVKFLDYTVPAGKILYQGAMQPDAIAGATIAETLFSFAEPDDDVAKDFTQYYIGFVNNGEGYEEAFDAAYAAAGATFVDKLESLTAAGSLKKIDVTAGDDGAATEIGATLTNSMDGLALASGSTYVPIVFTVGTDDYAWCAHNSSVTLP
ncbi:hypothetical protein [Brevibacillus fulvus]|uniref:S-layer protein SbsC C-terminal domain-containing protein n=1 Tax=Brevibacillus fulvus TaxID=1125967 RepID=A0A938Y1C1_9BACL|nr:hypothetical protein [Brevibacillus fulvus]MBM7591536.1 hypothetical protein [Brevibacillus fulvus]